MGAPVLPPKRTRPLDPTAEEDEDLNALGINRSDRQHKRQRPINDEHVTRRKPPTRRAEDRAPAAVDTTASSIQANPSLSGARSNKSTSSGSTRVLPGGFPSQSTESSWSPWLSDSSPVKIFWTRTFLSMRSTLADAFGRLVRSREQRRALAAPPAEVVAPLPDPQTPPRRPLVHVPASRFAALTVAEAELQEGESENEEHGIYGAEIHNLILPQTTIALGGHTIQLSQPTPRLLSGIHLDEPGPSTWPPRMPSMHRPPTTASDTTEIDPDAQRRPEFGFRDATPSVHANSLYDV